MTEETKATEEKSKPGDRTRIVTRFVDADQRTVEAHRMPPTEENSPDTTYYAVGIPRVMALSPLPDGRAVAVNVPVGEMRVEIEGCESLQEAFERHDEVILKQGQEAANEYVSGVKRAEAAKQPDPASKIVIAREAPKMPRRG